MKTYQEFEKDGVSESGLIEFVRSAVNDHKKSTEYSVAKDAEEYYAKRNVTISKYQKYLTDTTGRNIPDIWSANYKLTHGFFRRFVIQQTQYVLSNGVTFQKDDTSKKLGNTFDYQLQKLAKKALVDGVSYGYWNHDHLEVFSFVETGSEAGFVPITDEITGELRAGIRFWSVSGTDRWTLYEEDGYTEFVRKKGGEMEVLQQKKAYISRVKTTKLHGVEESVSENYGGLPIIPMYANDLRESELVGIRASIDCYDFIKSGMANTIDETSAFYWILKGSGGMDDSDLAQFVARMKALKSTVLDRGIEAEAHTLNVPTEANQALLDRLRSDLYEDAMLLDVEKALTGNITATAIRLAYQAQDDKCGDFEYCIRDFISRLFDLIGVEDEPSFKWNRIANQTEETQMVLTAANYLDDEAVLNHLPWLTNAEVNEILARRDSEDAERLNARIDKIEEELAPEVTEEPVEE